MRQKTLKIYSYRCGDWYYSNRWDRSKTEAVNRMGEHIINHRNDPTTPQCRPILVEETVIYEDRTTS